MAITKSLKNDINNLKKKTKKRVKKNSCLLQANEETCNATVNSLPSAEIKEGY